MITRRKRTLFTSLIALVVAVLGVGIGASLSQEQPPEATEAPIGSIFAEDTSAPPCWFGLIPGESTSADVEQMLSRYEDTFLWYKHPYENGLHPQTAYILEGYYNLYWRKVLPPEIAEFNSTIAIEAEKVTSIRIIANEIVLLGDVIDILRQPDDIRFFEPDGLPKLKFIYLEPLIVVNFTSDFNKPCNITDLRTSFWVHYIVYYSLEAATEVVEIEDVLYPKLFTPSLDYEKQVPLEVWNQWIAGEVDVSCTEAINSLSEEIILPDFP